MDISPFDECIFWFVMICNWTTVPTWPFWYFLSLSVFRVLSLFPLPKLSVIP
jgi:hypothetical protein